MRNSKAKKIRSKIYGDNSQKVKSYENDINNCLVNIGIRSEYLMLKNKLKNEKSFTFKKKRVKNGK